MPSGPATQPVSIGFMPRARRPRARAAASSAHATVVFPTPVSVPVTKKAFTAPRPGRRDTAATSASISPWVIDSGGISTTTSPSGRSSTPLAAGGGADPRSGGGLGRERRRAGPVGDQLDADHQAALADVADMRVVGELVGECPAQALDLGRQGLENPVALEQIERGEGRRAAERVAGEGVTVKEGPAVAGPGAEELIVDPLGGQGRGERRVAAGQSLGQAQEIGRDVLLGAGEQRTGAAEAGRHLVGDEQDVVLAAEGRGPGQVARRVDEHAGGALDQRLQDEGGDLVAVLVQQLGQGGERLVADRRPASRRTDAGTGAGSARRTISMSSGPKMAWKSGMPPTATAPSVSP